MQHTPNAETDPVSHALVPGRCVRLSDETAHVAIPGHQAASQPRVDLIRDGDEIQAIVVTCTCGERIRLRCVYPKLQ